ncbi:MAG: hypothetical protein HAW60_01320 [Bdellovibrionales bacterium]|nr:hypothetical protein [Bdellovibrionales bacterium]
MKYFLISLCLLAISCEGIDLAENIQGSKQGNRVSPATTPARPSESASSPADNFNSAISLSNINQERFSDWKNLYLSEHPILSSINKEDIKFYLNLSDEGGDPSTYSGNISFKFTSNQEEKVIVSAYTGQETDEIKYNYVYAYNNEEGDLRYAWKAFFESTYGAFLIVLKNGVANENNKVIFSMSEGNLYYKNWIYLGDSGIRGSIEPSKLGSKSKCWLQQEGKKLQSSHPTRKQSGLADLAIGSFDCRTWRTSFFDKSGANSTLTKYGVDITRSLEPDELYEYKYRAMIGRTTYYNFHKRLYPYPPILSDPPSTDTFFLDGYDRMVGILIKNRNKTYSEIHEALDPYTATDQRYLSRMMFSEHFRTLAAAIPIKLAKKPLSSLAQQSILNTYKVLLERDAKALLDFDNPSLRHGDKTLLAVRKQILKINIKDIGNEFIHIKNISTQYRPFYNRMRNNGFGYTYKSHRQSQPTQSPLSKTYALPPPLWQTSYIKLADFSNSNIKISFDLNGAARIASLKKQSNTKGNFSTNLNNQRSISSVKSEKKFNLIYKFLIVGLGLLFVVFLIFVIRKKLASK